MNSQQATRDLLNLAIQDNFNLKDENARLRERMMHLEQELSENRRRDEARREMLERRLERLEEMTYRPPAPATPPDSETKAVSRRRRGWLARLLGL
jgi:septal ring factor EnvC (AmiA/AmiB activator)